MVDNIIHEKRCIMLTVTLSDKIYDPNQTGDQVMALNDAIVSFINKLKPTDYLCVNIGSYK